MQVTATVTVNIPGLERYQKAIRAQLISGVDGPVNKALRNWARRYRSFVQRRFVTYSRGGGDWPPLSPLTIARRRKGRGNTLAARMRKGDFRSAADRRISSVKIKHSSTGKSRLEIKRPKPIKLNKPITGPAVAILRDTGSLFNALAPTLTPPPGSINKFIPGGIEVGYGGGSGHPSGGVTIAELAYWHQTGAGNLPVRQIIVDPDAETLDGMRADMQRALDDQSKST